jgi:putative phosphoribosyl transferase
MGNGRERTVDHEVEHRAAERERAIVPQRITLPTGAVGLHAVITLPETPRALVLIVHGCHPGAECPRDHVLAATLHHTGIATVMADLLTPEEDHGKRALGSFRYDVDLLSRRIDDVAAYLAARPATRALPLGIMAGQEDATSLVYAIARRPDVARAAVLIDPYLHIAGPFLPALQLPTLLLVTRDDVHMLRYASQAVRSAPGKAELRVFHAPTPSPPVELALGDHVARWFQRHLTPAPSAVASGSLTVPGAPLAHPQETSHAQ